MHNSAQLCLDDLESFRVLTCQSSHQCHYMSKTPKLNSIGKKKKRVKKKKKGSFTFASFPSQKLPLEYYSYVKNEKKIEVILRCPDLSLGAYMSTFFFFIF